MKRGWTLHSSLKSKKLFSEENWSHIAEELAKENCLEQVIQKYKQSKAGDFIAQWITYLLPTQQPRAQIPPSITNVSWEHFEAAEAHQWRCKNSRRLANVDPIHLVLASCKVVLQKSKAGEGAAMDFFLTPHSVPRVRFSAFLRNLYWGIL